MPAETLPLHLNQPEKDYYAPMHTAEHLLNATMVRSFGCERSFSNHIERKKSKCDYRFSRPLTDQEVEQIEVAVNQALHSSIPVTESFFSRCEAQERFCLDRLPSEASETLRVVSIGDYDHCLCIGKHVQNTCEVGSFKIISTDFNAGILRIRYKLTPPLSEN